jgi:hypothetical protein
VELSTIELGATGLDEERIDGRLGGECRIVRPCGSPAPGRHGLQPAAATDARPALVACASAGGAPAAPSYAGEAGLSGSTGGVPAPRGKQVRGR